MWLMQAFKRGRGIGGDEPERWADLRHKDSGLQCPTIPIKSVAFISKCIKSQSWSPQRGTDSDSP